MEKYISYIVIFVLLLFFIVFYSAISRINKKLNISESMANLLVPWQAVYEKIGINKVFYLLNDIILILCLVFVTFVLIMLVIMVVGYFIIFIGFIVGLCSLFTYMGIMEFGINIVKLINGPLSILNYLTILIPVILILVFFINIYPFYKLCVSFGKPKSLAVILAFIWPITIFVLAYDKSVYIK